MGLKTLEIPYPEDLPEAMGESREAFEQELKFLVAAKLYELGRITSGRAAELAGLNRVEFLDLLGRYRISVFNYPLEELERENVGGSYTGEAGHLKIVCNTSPLILLAKIGRLDLLFQLYNQVMIPVSVLEEVKARPGKDAREIKVFVKNKTLKIQKVSREILRGVPVGLGSGERETIALAIETEADLVVLDDQQGRHIARERDLRITGTIGVLIQARERGIISSVRQELDRLVEAGMWIDEAFYHRLLQEFDE